VISSNGWLIVQRDLTGSIQATDAPEVWVTAVFSTPSQLVAGSNIAGSAQDSLAGAVHQASRAPLAGAPTGPPAGVLASPELVDQVRAVLGQEGLRVAVDEVVPPDWAEDVLAELAGHLAGRHQADDPPAPEEWALLHQQAAAYAQAQPWDRRDGDVHLRFTPFAAIHTAIWNLHDLGRASHWWRRNLEGMLWLLYEYRSVCEWHGNSGSLWQ